MEESTVMGGLKMYIMVPSPGKALVSYTSHKYLNMMLGPREYLEGWGTS